MLCFVLNVSSEDSQKQTKVCIASVENDEKFLDSAAEMDSRNGS